MRLRELEERVDELEREFDSQIVWDVRTLDIIRWHLLNQHGIELPPPPRSDE